MSDKSPIDRATHPVHLRWVWGGLALSLLGVGVLGWGISLPSWTPSIVGTALLLLGATLFVARGGLHDAETRLAIGEEVQELRHGTIRQGIAPGDTIPSEDARKAAAATSSQTRALLGARPHGPRAMAPVAGGVLITTMVVVMVLQGSLPVSSPTGQSSTLRDTGLAILIGLAGIRIATSPGRHFVAIGVAGFAGVLLVLGGFLAGHTRTSMAAVEVIAGVLVILASLTALQSPDTGP